MQQRREVGMSADGLRALELAHEAVVWCKIVKYLHGDC